jgi:hypothetical protein
MSDKKTSVNLKLIGIGMLDKEMTEMLIDALIDHYTDTYGIELDDLTEPEKPTYDCETFDDAKEYLKKFRLEN